MSGGKRIRDHWKITAGFACGVSLLLGLAAGTHWHLAVKVARLVPVDATLALSVRASQPSFALAPKLASPPLAISHPEKLALAPGSAVFSRQHAAAPSPALSPAARAQAMKVFAGLPMMFEANNGQTDPRVKFLARAPGYTLFLADKEAVLSLPTAPPEVAATFPGKHSRGLSLPHLQAPRPVQVVRLKFAGASTPAAITGRGQLPGKTNYFIGNDPKQWRTNVPNYSAVEYRDIYPGVDARFHGDNRQLEFDFDVAPGADPSTIALEVQDARRLRVNSAGDVLLHLAGKRDVLLGKPHIYQETPQGRREIPGHYVLAARNRIAFALSPYDHSKALVIDPTLAYSTYLGGSNVTGAANDAGIAIAADSYGDVYVAGTTTSIDFPVTTGAYQSTYPSPGSTSGFVTELNPSGSSLIYSTYFGNTSGSTNVTAIALDAMHDAYLTGYTNSDNFPTTPGAYKTSETASGLYAFATELNSTGTGLVYSTYLSGTETTGTKATYGFGIAVDVADNAYVVGTTTSATYPTTAGAFQPVQGCASPTACGGNGFVTEVSAGGASLAYSTYLGTGSNKPLAVTLDSSGDAFVVGSTGSTTFPVTAGAFQTTSSDSVTAFVAELNPSGTALVYSTFLSGSNSGTADEALAVAVDASGDAFVTGQVGDSDFPTTVGAFQRSLLDHTDAFVAKLNNTGSALVYSTYLPGLTTGYGIAVNSLGQAYVVGTNYGNAGTFVTTPDALQASSPTTTTNGFLTVLNSAGSGVVYSTYIGVTSGNMIAYAYALAVDSSGNAYITGAAPPNFPTTPGAFKTNLTANANYPNPRNGFVMKFSLGIPASISATAGTPQNATINTAFATALQATIQDSSGNPVSGVTVTFTAPAAGGSGTFANGTASTTATTDASGQASATPFTANATAGGYAVTATVAGVTTAATFSLTNTAGSAASVTATAGTPQSATINTAFGTALQATVQDSSGNPVSGVSVTFTAPATGASGTFASGSSYTTTTNTSGVAMATTFTANGTAGGPYTVTATAAGVTTPASFSMTNSSSTGPPPAVVMDNETITVTDTPTFPDVFDTEKITVTDTVMVTASGGQANTATTTTIPSAISSFDGFPLPANFALVGTTQVGVSFTVKPASGSATPTGSVTVTDGFNDTCSAALAAGGAGSCTLTISQVGSGSTPLTAAYTPDSNASSNGLLASTSPALTENVVQIVSCGGSAPPATITLGSIGTSSFMVCLAGDVSATPTAVTTDCLPYATCTLTVTPISGKPGAYTVAIRIATTAVSDPLQNPHQPRNAPLLMMLLALSTILSLLLAFLLARHRGGRLRLVYATGLLLVLTVAGVAGCTSASVPGSPNNTGTPLGNSIINVTVAAGGFSVVVPVNVMVTK